MATITLGFSTRTLLLLHRSHHRPLLGQATSRLRSLATLSAADAAEQMLNRASAQGTTTTTTYRQTLDGHQLQKLSLTLGRRHLWAAAAAAATGEAIADADVSPPRAGTPLPPGYHLAYFAPAALEAALGADGTHRAFNAPAPFTRRMWAGGEMVWTAGVPLRVGDEVEERTRLVGASAKRSRHSGGEMVLVEVEKEFWGPRGLALVDRRAWVFRPPPAEASADARPWSLDGHPWKPSMVEDLDAASGSRGRPARRVRWSPVGLFRFSALTFNAHMIHYNERWTRQVEGHAGGVVVHGPLNLIGMLDYWRDVHADGREARRIAYRALAPLYAGDEYLMRADLSAPAAGEGEGEGPKVWELAVVKGDKVCMKGSVTAHA